MDLDRFKKTPSAPDEGQAQAWAAWLRDEPAPSAPNQAAASQPHAVPPRPRHPVASSPPQAQTPQPQPVTPVAVPHHEGTPTAVPTTNVSININLPKFTRPTLPKLPYKKIGLVAAAVALLIGLGLTVRYFIDAAVTRHKAYEAAHAVTLNRSTSKPTFAPVVPANASATVAKTAAFDGTRDSYSFSDYLNGTQLLVSQQPVPATFNSAQDAVAKIAKSMKATTPLLTKGLTAYEATDKSGTQTVVYAVNNVLLFIQSPFEHDTSSWISYLNTLK